jgi:organic radical activating enzyme
MVVEIFSSIQGEGVHLGRRQIFIRLADCNLACAYCDTEFFRASLFPCEIRPGCGFSTDMPNPVASYEIAELVAGWNRDIPGAHHSISITGGEPLCQAEALAVWLPELRKILPVHLETNGTLPAALAPLLSAIDFISMDLKLASVTGVVTPWEEHRRFLTLAVQRPCQVKLVVGAATSFDELLGAVRFVHEIAPQVPLVLQPQSIERRVSLAAHQLLQMQAVAAAIHADIRVIPQVHHFLNAP